MSRVCLSSTQNIMHTDRQKAFDNFRLIDNKTVALSVSVPLKLNELKPLNAIIVTGYIPPETSRFAINLTCRAHGNIALHFNPRLDRGYVVRNTRVKGHWQKEETCSPRLSNGYIFQRNEYFHLMIFCAPYDFQIAINGEHFCSFHYRMPLSEVVCLEVDGNIEDIKARQIILDIYPDPKICKPTRSLELTDDELLSNNLAVPVNINIKKGLKYGARLFIQGRLKLLPYSFYVNLQRGDLIYPHPEIALHINPRFHYGNAPACVVINCWTEGKWSNEERHEGYLSWGPGREFLLTIRVEFESYTIWLGSKMIGEFKHRMKPTIVDTLRISGDLALNQLAIKYND